GGHHACERGQSPGEGPEAVGAGRPGRRPAGRSLAVREQRRQTQEQVLVEKLQDDDHDGSHWCNMFWSRFLVFLLLSSSSGMDTELQDESAPTPSSRNPASPHALHPPALHPPLPQKSSMLGL
ncbi:hypothetical protein NQZ68_002210, partial [Dissostichus eleginoides]